ncbi:hypothetical protein [Streptomyces halobius]|uniref:Uncharacterized protein n=1 Tax=Streptomyces halobius TaxID=2879846 RepID=A0ABY4M0I5_9ACTN|nr:hypothetical protein [Streptomyces halobius]UQA91245.1 hypothetical protein K9S39_04545 [Streptomyces halobius]
MHVLLPNDPVWAVKFFQMEEPLLHSLSYFYIHDLPPDEASCVRTAYASWARINVQLPSVFRDWASSAEVVPGIAADTSYKLHAPQGRRLTEMYAVDVEEGDLQELAAFHALLRRAEMGGTGTLARSIEDIAQDSGHRSITADFGRVLAVLQLKADPTLLNPLCHTDVGAPREVIALNDVQEVRYRSHCDSIIRILSNGDPWLSTTHRHLYP